MTTYSEAVEQTITAGEQIHQIVNGTATTEVTVEDGSKVPSIRKALLDNFYFKDPIAWQVGQTEKVFNQLRKFTDGSWWYAPSATASNPVSMGSTPVGDSLWKIYYFDAVGKLTPQIREALRRSYAEAGYNLVAGSFEAGGTLVNANDVLLQERTGKAFSGPAGTVAAGTNPASGGFVDKSGLATSASAISNANGGSVQDFIDAQTFVNVDAMLAFNGLVVGQRYSTGGTTWEYFRSGTFPATLNSFKNISKVYVTDFGARGDGVTDDTFAVQRAIDYAGKVCTEVHFPSGEYIVSDTINVHVPTSGDGSIIISGAGFKSVIHQVGAGKVGLLFSTTTFILHSHIKNMTIKCGEQSSHGIVIGSGIGDCSFTDVNVTVLNTDASCWYGDFRPDTAQSLGAYTSRWVGGTWKLAKGSNVPGFHILTRGSYFNQNTIDGVTAYFSNGEQFFKLESTDDRHIGNVFNNITFEVCGGGGFYFNTLFECHFENIVFYDFFDNYKKNLFHCEKGTAKAQSSNCTFKGLSRQGGTLASGVYDFFASNLVYSTFYDLYSLYTGGIKMELGNSPNTILGLTKAQMTNVSGAKNVTHISYWDGIKFPASEQYFNNEHGALTLVLTGYEGAPTVPVTTVAYYSAIGGIFTIVADFNNVSTVGASGHIAVTGIPKKFMPLSRSVGIAVHNGISSPPEICPIVDPTDTVIFFIANSGSLGKAYHSVGTGKRLSLTISYPIG